MRAQLVGLGRQAFRTTGHVARRTRTAAGRADERPAPWDADLLDDLAFLRPWNIVIKAARRRAHFKKNKLRTGVTIIIVNWNTLAVLRDTIDTVRALTPGLASHEVVLRVVDNGSTDDSAQWLRSQRDVELLALPTNPGHSIALDLAVLTCETDIAVTLDSDAVPLSPRWIPSVTSPIRESDAILSGSKSKRGFVHPMLMAVDVREFIEQSMTFQVFKMPGVTSDNEVWGENAFDTGEWMSRMVKPHQRAYLETIENSAPDLPGMTAGDALGPVVYHHGGVSRMAATSKLDPRSYSHWRGALMRVLPDEALPLGEQV